jgi:hypothetical protein
MESSGFVDSPRIQSTQPGDPEETMKKCLLAVRLLAAPTLAQAPAQEQAEIALHAAG